MYKERVDPRESMSDREFKSHFRFSKTSVNRITELLRDDLSFETRRGLPVPPPLQVCIALNHYSGGHFQRISGWCAGVSQNAARLCLVRVTDALIRRKNQFIFMPSADTMQDTAERMQEKFKLPRFAFAVDGVHVRFTNAPNNLPANKTAQMFWGRKQFYSINVQVVGNDRLMYDLDVGWPGSTHDARVWTRSQVRRFIERQKRFLVAGDTGYPVSENLVKPYSTNEAGNDRTKRLFNKRLSGLRTVMSECLFGVWKRRFPILKNLRTDFSLSQRIVVATAILQNMARMWEDEEPSDDEEDSDSDDDHSDEDDAGADFIVQDAAPATVRMRGQILRERMKDGMPPR